MVRITVDLDERRAEIGDVTVELSNYNLKHIRQHKDHEIDSEDVRSVLQELIDLQIIAFLRDAGKPVNDQAIEQEAAEAFDTHLYLLTDPD